MHSLINHPHHPGKILAVTATRESPVEKIRHPTVRTVTSMARKEE